MNQIPSRTEWNTSALTPERRAYLDSGLAFEDIAARIVREATIDQPRICPLRSPPRRMSKIYRLGTRQIVFRICVSREGCDLLYNAPDGMRGRYWQSPTRGDVATRYLIGALSPRLLDIAECHPPSPPIEEVAMALPDIQISLASASAKIWPREWDEARNWLLISDELNVRQWSANEARAEINKGMWRLSPKGGELEV